MLKTPEQYFADLNFDPPDTDQAPHALNSGERVFVEKYLGLDMLKDTVTDWPKPQLQMQRRSEPKYRPVLEPKIEIAPRKLEISEVPALERPAPEIPEGRAEIDVSEEIPAQPKPEAKSIAIAEKTPKTTVPSAAPVKTVIVSPAAQSLAPVAEKPLEQGSIPVKVANVEESAEKPEPAKIIETPSETSAPVAPPVELASKPVVEQTPPENEQVTLAPAVSQTQDLAAEDVAQEQTIVTMRDLASLATNIRMVSFYVENQLFLLPVAGIYEVLRHMELIKVPQAPYFVAGAINLRGNVMPLIHLSALLTNQTNYTYSERSFIIVYGTEKMRLGLIIDKINSMHMLDTNKIIWNVESRLGDAGDFLCAIANLDDRVCGILAPEMITQKLLSS